MHSAQIEKRTGRIGLLLLTGCLCIFVAGTEGRAEGSTDFRIRPVASESILYKSPDPKQVSLATPGLAVCPDGRIIATFDVSGTAAEYKKMPGVEQGGRCLIFTSDDLGETWTHRANMAMTRARPFFAGGSLYIIGVAGDIRIARSDDRGETWSAYSRLTNGENWSGSGNNVLVKENHVYLSMNRRVYDASQAWPVAESAPHLLRANLANNLLEASNWTVSEAKAFIDYFDDRKMETLFGIPFYPAFYPDRFFSGRRSASPVGWLEGNAVQITDPNHLLYDPSGKTVHLFLRTNTGLTNIGCLMKVIENDDGTMTTHVEKTPSGKDLSFMALPGGHQTFYIHYDAPGGLYWMLATQTTDSMTRGELLDADRFGMAYDERRRLALYFSTNLFDWCFAGLAASGATERQSRHCVSMAIAGENLFFLSRSGDAEASSAHDCNLITFHRIRDFRSLAY